MRRQMLLRQLRAHDCVLVREGDGTHSGIIPP